MTPPPASQKIYHAWPRNYLSLSFEPLKDEVKVYFRP